MKIYLAKNSGLCFGVKRALDIVDNKKTTVLGKLIHNPQVIERLSNNGVRFVDSFSEIYSKEVVISAQGVPESTITKIKEKSISIIDATCPLVKKVQELAKQLEKGGYTVVMIGDPKHTEVVGVTKDLKDCLIIKNENEVKKAKDKKIGIIVQTTQDFEKTKKIVEKLKKTASSFKYYNTICTPTKSRQASAIELAKKVQLMIVVGGYKSANTKRLAEICSKITKTKHIETAEELKKEWFKDIASVGITAGASTPDWIIDKVIKRIKNIA